MTHDEMVQRCACLVAAHNPDLAPSHVIDRAVAVTEAYEEHLEKIFKSETRGAMSQELQDEFDEVCDRDVELQRLRKKITDTIKELRGSPHPLARGSAVDEEKIAAVRFDFHKRRNELRKTFNKRHGIED